MDKVVQQQKGVNSVVNALKSKMKAKIKNLTLINETHQIEIESYKQRIHNLENQLDIYQSSRLDLGLDESKLAEIKNIQNGERMSAQKIAQCLETNEMMMQKEKQVNELIQNDIQQKEYFEKKLQEQMELIEKQNERLREQKNKIKKSKKVKQQLDNVEQIREQQTNENGQLKDMISQQEDMIKDQEKTIEQKNIEIERHVENIQKNQQTFMEFTKEMELLKHENDKLAGQIRNLGFKDDDTESVGASTKIDMIQQQIEQKELFIEDLQNSLEMMREGNQAIANDKQQLEEEVKKIKEEFNRKGDQISELTKEKEEQQQMIEQMKQKEKELEQELEIQQNNNMRLNVQVEEQLKMIQSNQAIYSQQKMQNQKLMEQNTNLLMKIQQNNFDDESELGSIGASSQLDQVQAQLEQKDLMIEGLQQTIKILREENEKLQK